MDSIAELSTMDSIVLGGFFLSQYNKLVKETVTS